MGGYVYAPNPGAYGQPQIPGQLTTENQYGNTDPFVNTGMTSLNSALGQQANQIGLGYQSYFGDQSNYFGNQLGQATQGVQGFLNPIEAGNGQYTPYSQEQLQNIQQQPALQNIQSQLPSNYFSQGQTQSIEGNPYQAYNNFAPQADAIGATAGGISQDLADQVDAYSQGAQGIYGNTQTGVTGNLQGGETALSQIENNQSLNPTGQYLQQAGMSDAQVQQMALSGAQSVGAQYQATEDQIKQAAEAAGTATPMGLAASLGALDRSSSADQATALVNAQLQAQAAQRTAAQNVQNTQLNAGQYQAGLGSSNTLAQENAGIAANESIGQLGIQNDQNLLAQSLGATTTGGELGLNASEYNATTGAGLESQAEQLASNRNYQLAANQQQTGEFNEGMEGNLANQQSQLYQQSYAPQLQQLNQGETMAEQQQGFFGGEQNNANSQALQSWNQQQQGTSGAAGRIASWQSSPGGIGLGQSLSNAAGGMIESALGAGSRAYQTSQQSGGGGGGEHGKYVDAPQLIQVGEGSRPEVILPLDPATPPDHRNVWEQMGSKLGEAMGIDKKGPDSGYASGGVVGMDQPNLFSQDQRSLALAEHPDIELPDDGFARGGIPMIPGRYQPGMPIQPRQFAPQMGGTAMPQQGAMSVQPPSLAAGTSPQYRPQMGGQPTMGYARGGVPGMMVPRIAAPRIPMPHMGVPHMMGGRVAIPRVAPGGIHLNMPVRQMRIQAPIRPQRLPVGGPQKFERGGIPKYKMRMDPSSCVGV